jgi:hypothetical protein
MSTSSIEFGKLAITAFFLTCLYTCWGLPRFKKFVQIVNHNLPWSIVAILPFPGLALISWSKILSKGLIETYSVEPQSFIGYVTATTIVATYSMVSVCVNLSFLIFLLVIILGWLNLDLIDKFKNSKNRFARTIRAILIFGTSFFAVIVSLITFAITSFFVNLIFNKQLTTSFLSYFKILGSNHQSIFDFFINCFAILAWSSFWLVFFEETQGEKFVNSPPQRQNRLAKNSIAIQPIFRGIAKLFKVVFNPAKAIVITMYRFWTKIFLGVSQTSKRTMGTYSSQDDYRNRKNMYKAWGYSEAEADRKAKEDIND